MEPRCDECPYQRPGQQRIPGVDLERKKIVVGSAPDIPSAVKGRLVPADEIRTLVNGAEVGYTSAVECFPGTEIVKADFKAAAACCAPRLEAEIAGKDVLVLGGEATAAVSGAQRAITKYRGTVTEGDLGTRRAVYTLHPGFVARAGGLSTTAGVQLKSDVETWLGRKQSRPEVQILIDPPRIKLPPRGTPVVVDIETTGLDPEKGSPLKPGNRPKDVGDEPRIRCYGFAWREDSSRSVRGDDQGSRGSGVRGVSPGREEGSAAPRGHLLVAVFSRPNATVRRLLDGRYPLIAQNHAFEVKWLDRHGPVLNGNVKRLSYADRDWSDTMLTAHALHEDRGEESTQRAGYRLDQLVSDFLPWTFPKGEMLGEYNVLTAPLDVLMPYCGWDCVKELLIHERWEGELHEHQGAEAVVRSRLRHIALPGLRFLDRVERRGMPFSAEGAAGVVDQLEDQRDKLGAFLADIEDINWNSRPEVQQQFKKMGLKPSGLKTPTGQHMLGGLAWAGIRARNPEHRAMIDAIVGPEYPARKPMGGYQGALKLLATLDPGTDKNLYRYVDEEQRIHCRLSIVGTSTGRLSATSPPLHNMAEILRACFVAPKGQSFLAMDVSGSEISWMAHYSGDERLMALAESGESLHSVVAEELGIPRPRAKALNFALGYGGGAPAVKRGMDAVEWGSYTEDECRELVTRRKSLFPGYQQWCREQEAFVVEHGFVVSDFGWVRRLPAAQGPRWGESFHESMRQAVNTPIQSASSDAVLYRAMEMERELGLEVVLLKHDEILALVPTKRIKTIAKQMREIMGRRNFYWGDVRVPLFVDFKAGPSWFGMKEVNI